MVAVGIKTGAIKSAVGVSDERLPFIVNDWRRVITIGFQDDCRSVVQMVDEVRALKIYERLGYQTEDDFYNDEMMIKPQHIAVAYEFLKENGEKKIGWDEAIANAESTPVGSVKLGPKTNGEGVYYTPLRKGTSQERTLRRLAGQHPDLFEQVKAGKLSPNAAAIQAGFRKPTRTIPVDTPESAVTALLRVFTREQITKALQ